MTLQQYIINFLLGNGNETSESKNIFYGHIDSAPDEAKIIIAQSNFFEDGIYGTNLTLPKVPFSLLPNSDIPFLFGESLLQEDSKGRFILYADIIASAYFMLSRYEEIIKPACRDKFARFLAKDSVVFQQGYGLRPLVDEWGLYLRDLLRKVGVPLPEEKPSLNKVYLTHDVDTPFKFYKWYSLPVQIVRNILHRGVKLPVNIKSAITGLDDPYYTFGRIIEYDNQLKKSLPNNIVQSIYFLIVAGAFFTKNYCNIKLTKFKWMLRELKASGAIFGLHISFEGGKEPKKIKKEANRFKTICETDNLYSRHHFLRWHEPEDIEYMEESGITDDFTLGYADQIGFRCGTSRPYNFINPKTKNLTSVNIHPMQIMECTLDRSSYMNLNYNEASKICKKVIYEVFKYNGELNILWHNTSFLPEFYHEKLYSELINYIKELVKQNNISE